MCGRLLRPPQQDSFALCPTTPQEIIDFLGFEVSSSSHFRRSPGPDEIDPLVAKTTIEPVNNNNNNYDNLYGALTRPYRYKGALQATTLGRP